MNKITVNDFPLLYRVVGWILLPLILLSCGVFWYLNASVAQTQGHVLLAGLKTPVSLERDASGVVYIQSEKDTASYFGLGFAHAQDRLWQMEMNRRIAAGRLAEILGAEAIPSDRLVRRLGLYRNAHKMLQGLDETAQQALQAYVAGVNAAMAQSKVLPPEFLLLDVTPEPWQAVDSLAYMQLMSWQLSTNMAFELQRTLLIQSFGLEKANQLMPAIELNDEELPMPDAMAALSDGMAQLPQDALLPKRYVGSNSWVVGPAHTANGYPILANDPHLSNQIPSLWYLASLKGDKLNVTGATFPGLPFVAVGRNADIAWGTTTLMADTQDVFIEKINPLNPYQYELDGRMVDMEVYQEEIRVKKDPLMPEQAPLKITVRRTVNGPVLSDEYNPLSDFAYSVRWTGDEQRGGTFNSFIKLNYARDWFQFKQALSSFVAPAHAFTYADVKGNIGLLAPGLIPLRGKGQGNVPVAGWQQQNHWQGFIGFERAIEKYNPPSGIIVAANHRLHDDAYPYHISDDWAPGIRAERIEKQLAQLLQSKDGKLTAQDMDGLIGDQHSLAATSALPRLLAVKPQSEAGREVQQVLHSWDGLMDKDSAAAGVYSVWMAHFYRLLIEDDLRGSTLRGSARYSVMSLLDEPNVPFVTQVLQGSAALWCDYLTTESKESCDELLVIALEHAVNELNISYGSSPDDWRWGKLHKAQFPHFPFSDAHMAPAQPPRPESIFAELFHREIDTGGSGYTVNLASTSLAKQSRFAHFFGPGYRQVVSLAPNGQGRFSINTGQSGNVFSRHYDDLIAAHEAMAWLSMNQAERPERLLLQPKDSAGE